MVKITGKIGKIFLLIILFCCVTSFGFSKERNIEDTDIYVDFFLWFGDKIIKQKQIYPIVEFEFGVTDFPDEQFIFTAKKNSLELKCDLTSVILDNYVYVGRDKISFYEAGSNLNMLLIRADLNCYVINFDFNKRIVNVKNIGTLSPVFEELDYRNSDFEITFDFVYDVLINHVLNVKNNVECFFKDNDAVDMTILHYNSYPKVILRDNEFITETYIKNDSIIQNVPPSIKDAMYGFYEALGIKNVVYKTNSFLTEGTIEYTENNLASFSNVPWCPTQNYINEEIYITSKDEVIEGILFGNGYYRDDKKYLFLQNSRVKEIEIEFLDSGLKQTSIIADTGYLQYIPFIDVNSRNIKIKILSVYEGTKYSDLCINCIIPFKRVGEYEIKVLKLGM